MRTIFRILQKTNEVILKDLCCIQGWPNAPERLDYSRTGHRIKSKFGIRLYKIFFLEGTPCIFSKL